jgi:hypothetical protein
MSNVVILTGNPATKGVGNFPGGVFTGDGGRSNYLYLSAQLGNPVMSDFATLPFNYTNINAPSKSIFVPPLVIEKVLYTVKFPKHIIKTEISGRVGSVKEYINTGDAEINIKGTIYGPNGTYPEEDVIALITLCQAPVSFAVTSWYLLNFNITNLVITGYSVPQEAGGISYQNFELNCLSDVPVELLQTQNGSPSAPSANSQIPS